MAMALASRPAGLLPAVGVHPATQARRFSYSTCSSEVCRSQLSVSTAADVSTLASSQGCGLSAIAFAAAFWTLRRARAATRQLAAATSLRAQGFGAKPAAKGFSAVDTKKKPAKRRPKAQAWKGSRRGGPAEDTEGPVRDAISNHAGAIVAGLRERGWWASETSVFPTGLKKALRAEVEALWEEGHFELSQSLRSNGEYYDKQHVYYTRIDKSKYEVSPRMVHYTVRATQKLAELISEAFPDVQLSGEYIGNKLNLCTGNGGSFDAHIDNGVGEEPFNRKLSIILYLNGPWRPELGGQLTLLGDESKGLPVQLEPTGGRMVIFWADQQEHKVEAAQAFEGLGEYRVSYVIWLCSKDDKPTPVVQVEKQPTFEAAPAFAQM
eukprot:TRINITY_DN16439_c0_g1_i1.p1 TRINITY_DN16439_c0_g1~~TRINITY_DN16439_c0_g1_i1.p1  ORF type:complete len:380 (+),score=72.30 TRINITY_DN16439_c0_g1_i1:67-1206(+)